MKFIKEFKLFENVNEKEIHQICQQYNIKNYTINSNGTVDVDGDVNLQHCYLETIPIKFGKVTGDFYCSSNHLISLKGCPESVGGNFDCSENKLISLEGAPKSIGEDFYCSHNQLVSLMGYPQSVGDRFYCTNNPIYKWWRKVDDIKYLDIFLDMNIHADDPDEINQEKIDIILGQ